MEKHILVTGATGYIAGRLIPLLLEEGHRVRCLARDPARLRGRAWSDQVEIVAGDVTSPATLPAALHGVQTAYYLVHNMASGHDYIRRDLEGARHFARAAEEAGVDHIIYLGGLADPAQRIAPHMRSRIETGEALREGRVPVTEFRAGVIVGPGSISFEMIRFLAEQFPLMAGPRWLENCSQPVAASDVLAYLRAALDNRVCRGKVYEIGGPDRMTYIESMLRYARARGLQRGVLLLPYVPVGLMAVLVGLLTPVPQAIASPLIEGLMADSVVSDDSALRDFPNIQPLDYESAMNASLAQLQPGCVERIWEADPRAEVRLMHEGFFIERHTIRVDADPQAVYRVVAGLGGDRGWLYADGLWQARGWLDRLLGGPGMRGRSHPDLLQEGDVVDFYRASLVEEGRCIRLKSELKAPGDGWMEWVVVPDGSGTRLTQTAFFAPRGLGGFLYWYGLETVHNRFFRGLIRKIVDSVYIFGRTGYGNR